MSSTMVKVFVSRLRSNFEAWRTGEIDYATLNEHQRATWQTIHAMGPQIEAAVVGELSAGAPLLEASRSSNGRRCEETFRSAHYDQKYRARIERTVAGSPALKTFPVDEHRASSHRQMAAVLYELAASLELLSQVMEAHWCITPEPHNDRIVIEIVSDADTVLADTLLVEIIQLHQLA